MSADFAERCSVAIFSCDRAAHLRNCVASVERHFPGAHVTVWDDASADPATLLALEEIGRRHAIRRRRPGPTVHLGGLRLAMAEAIAEGARDHTYLFMLQDDQQIVRPIDAALAARIEAVFEGDGRLTQVFGGFFRGYVAPRDLASRYAIDQGLGIYEDTGIGFADTGILHLSRFMALGLDVAASETAAAIEARRRGARLVIARDPWFMFCPWPNTVRRTGGRLEKAMRRINDFCIGAGVHPFADMTPEAIERLLARSIDVFPVADDWLDSTPGLPRPWWYTDAFDIAKMSPRTRLLDPRWPFRGPDVYERLRQAVSTERTGK
ncbi:MAG: hypothetical protein O9277_00530 [Magnetospirillum sp.]|nr:hypothetical protein [Magnetospirillum sp.]